MGVLHLIYRASEFGSCAAGVCAAVLLAHAAQAEPNIKRTIVYYDVGGATVQELRDDIFSKGPLIEGRRFGALTHSNVKWGYKYRPGANGCAITSVTTEVSLTITLPRLNGGTAPVEAAFNVFMENLMVHENGHVDIAIRNARQIEQRIGALPPEKTCDRVSNAANAIGKALIEDGSREQKAYDAKTQHGTTQGAQLRR